MAKLKLKKINSTDEPKSNEEAKLKQNKKPQTKEKRNLKDIVDRNKLFTMLYSGVEDDRNFRILYDMGIRNFLISYQYVQKKKLDVDNYVSLGVKFFVDSGAFTYMSDSKYSDFTIDDWEKQIVRYLNWAKRHKDIIFALASLDIEMIVGGEQVQKWNEKYFEPFMLETGIPVCFVWHEEATNLSWEQYCQRYPYVGVSWATEESDLNKGLEVLRVAEKYNTLVHGMAMTKTSFLYSRFNYMACWVTIWRN